MPFQHVIVAYDGSPESQTALDRAADLVRSTPDSRLTVVHAFHFPNFVVGEAMVVAPVITELESISESDRIMDEAKARVGDLPNTSFTMLQGDPAIAILENAEHIGADLIVIGSRGLGTFKEWVLGSVSHHVVQHAKIPVLVIKAPAQGR
ncbi:universal stress protein [Paenibacillus ginsengarvi]|uniref:Universal stress protein n=1 Tax=Paenibacillus ginsengarvi TaxID=400777 RepID=A0A3B0CKU2_9BACL|nr:universal stress protein [Paenibacillus ginsengarvi]RKN84849.1 universal stress protein [Paenibacillus ginsengarvi]